MSSNSFRGFSSESLFVIEGWNLLSHRKLIPLSDL